MIKLETTYLFYLRGWNWRSKLTGWCVHLSFLYFNHCATAPQQSNFKSTSNKTFNVDIAPLGDIPGDIFLYHHLPKYTLKSITTIINCQSLCSFLLLISEKIWVSNVYKSYLNIHPIVSLEQSHFLARALGKEVCLKQYHWW